MNLFDVSETEWLEKERKAYIEGDIEKSMLYGFIAELLSIMEDVE